MKHDDEGKAALSPENRSALNEELAAAYAGYDNRLNEYFDRVLLDLVTEDFRKAYHELRRNILKEIFRDNRCYLPRGSDSPVYTRHPAYDPVSFFLMEHYFSVKQCGNHEQALYETELMLVEHYLTLCGFRKDDEGYWFDREDALCQFPGEDPGETVDNTILNTGENI